MAAFWERARLILCSLCIMSFGYFSFHVLGFRAGFSSDCASSLSLLIFFLLSSNFLSGVN